MASAEGTPTRETLKVRTLAERVIDTYQKAEDGRGKGAETDFSFNQADNRVLAVAAARTEAARTGLDAGKAGTMAWKTLEEYGASIDKGHDVGAARASAADSIAKRFDGRLNDRVLAAERGRAKDSGIDL